MFSLFFTNVPVVFARGVADDDGTRLIKMTRPSVCFISVSLSVCLPAFCWEVNRRAAVVRHSCWPLTDCSGNCVLSLGGCQVNGGRDIHTIYFDTDTQASSELRARRAGLQTH